MKEEFNLSFSQNLIKRFFDVFLSFFGLILVSPLIILSWLVASIDTRSNGFYIQKRIGLHGRPFNLIKIKTMKSVSGIETSISIKGDARFTSTGEILRKYKLDELPQLINVFLGDMSFVGPRPDVPGYADKLVGLDRSILNIRPGITGPASLKYRNEEELLSKQDDPIIYNDQVIWPDKVRINLEYMDQYSFLRDIEYIIKTL